jgi:hypothetical protein
MLSSITGYFGSPTIKEMPSVVSINPNDVRELGPLFAQRQERARWSATAPFLQCHEMNPRQPPVTWHVRWSSRRNSFDSSWGHVLLCVILYATNTIHVHRIRTTKTIWQFLILRYKQSDIFPAAGGAGARVWAACRCVGCCIEPCKGGVCVWPGVIVP